MPYNTRRKSLSLTELGVHVPKRARAPSHATAHPLRDGDTAEPPNKKARCVPHFVSGAGSMSPPKTTTIRIKSDDPLVTPRGVEHTPPPSPGAPDRPKVSTEGIRDEVVVGAIIQLEKTGNRPHTSKELAAALMHTVPTIDSSTNPNALVQARLATYLKGPWPVVSPCPMGKQQENVHPRRVFYFLTAYPHQPIPDNSMQPPRRIVSPALSVKSDEDMEDECARQRTALSPSPEVDLSSPELDDDVNEADHASMYSSHGSLPRIDSSADLSHNHRPASPPLEREERDFKQTANQLQQQRRDSQQKSRQASEAAVKVERQERKTLPPSTAVNDTDAVIETAVEPAHEVVATLFGGHDGLAAQNVPSYVFSSPVLRPQLPLTSIDAVLAPPKLALDKEVHMSIEIADPMTDIWTWEEHKSPETIDLDELQCMFEMY